ncbi:carbohydrate porin [Methylopila sp. M107]|uniref:carbohydrate porin n=1 Tax=Methylopila sp. M107 TaxID=1101190 RepID=UPI00036FDC29|nr:carbohydrate porin [Methylopila sp. M107]
MRRLSRAGFAAALLAAIAPAPAMADDDDAKPGSAVASPAQDDDDDRDPSILDSVPALGPIKNARDALAAKGLTFSGFYFSDPRANLHGGMREGATYSGLLKVAIDADLETIAGVKDASVHVDMLQIHGRDLSEEYIGNVLSVNDIGARPTTRLFEAYYQQKLGNLTLKFGQLASDEEYFISDHAEQVFIGATFGWAAAPSLNLPQEGPAYPLAVLGAQAQYDVSDRLTVIGAIYNGYAARPKALDAEKANPHGLNFRLGDPPFMIAEARYRFEGLGGLPAKLKLGGYGHFGDFDDLKRGTDGLTLGAPGSNDDPRRHDGNLNLYAVLDQQLWRFSGDDPERGIGFFLRAVWGPKDRNTISAYVDGGLTAKGLLPGRPDDLAGVAVAWADFSPGLAAVDRAAADGAIRRYEAKIEATYKAQVLPGMTVAPTFQYVMRPGGGPPEDGGPRIPNATVFGVTTIVTF